jgi:SAM-dependent methyltransferase
MPHVIPVQAEDGRETAHGNRHTRGPGSASPANDEDFDLLGQDVPTVGVLAIAYKLVALASGPTTYLPTSWNEPPHEPSPVREVKDPPCGPDQIPRFPSTRPETRGRSSMEPSRFYTGLIADLYAPLRGHVYDDPEPWHRFIAEVGEPALELGCGDGDPLLALRQRGLDVEGVDSSPDMIARCRAAAAELGLSVTVHCQAMQDLDLGRRFRSIFLAGPTFNLLPDDDTARRALVAIAAHLTDDGQALIPLFIPTRTPSDQLGTARELRTDDGTLLRVTAIEERSDERARTRTTVLRYERHTPDGDVEQVERPWIVHWYDRDDFERLAAEAGLPILDVRPAAPDDPEGTRHVRLGRERAARELG